MKLDLQYFAGGHSVTLYKDAGVTTFTASADSDVQKNAEVTLTVVLETGYEVDEYEIIAGGVTVNASTKKFTMGEADVVIYLKSKANNKYIVTEDTDVVINGTKTHLGKNIKLLENKGHVYGANISGTAITFDAAVVAQLVADGILVKI